MSERPQLGLQCNDSTVSTQADIACITPDVSADQRAILQLVVNNADPDADILWMPEPQIRNRNSRRSEDKFLPLHAIAMERYCHRMTSVRLSVRNIGER